MRQSTYLNSILTVNAVLLTGLLWTQLAGRPLADQAEAQMQVGSIAPNAAEQRARMIELLASIKGSVDASTRAIEGGKTKVHVTNLNEIKFPEPKATGAAAAASAPANPPMITPSPSPEAR